VGRTPILRRPTPHRYPRNPPPIPPSGQILGGAAANSPTADLPTYVATLELPGIGFWRSFISRTDTIAPALRDANTARAALQLAWGVIPPTGGLAAIATGDLDAYLTTSAQQMEAFARPVYISPWWEFNGNWYDFSAYDLNMAPRPGNTPADFVAAWRHVYSIVKAIAPTNVHFVWCPHLWGPWQPDGGTITNADYWPGDAYVDWGGMTAYPPAAVFDYVAVGMQGNYDIAVAHGKPVMICEWAMEADDPGLFFQYRGWVDSHPEVRAMAYFYIGGGPPDWRIDLYPNAAFAVREWMKDPKWIRTISL
jgi:hypothetical protein